MTDVEPTGSGKRKSLSNKQGRKGTPKKFVPDTKTPEKAKAFALSKGVTPKKIDSSPNLNKQSSAQKLNKRNREDSESNSAKKLKPFAGTSQVQTPGVEKGKKKVKNENTSKNTVENVAKKEEQNTDKKEEQKGKRKSQFHYLTIRVKAGDEEVVKVLSTKINDIESRGELTKTAKKKLKLLIKLRKVAKGEASAATNQPAKSPDGKSVSTKRRERKKKNAALKAIEAPETAVKTLAKPAADKSNGKAIQGKPGNKQKPKKGKVEVKQEDSDNESEEGASDSGEEESGEDEEEDEESGPENAEEESGDEVEEEEGSDEGEAEDSDEGEEEEESEEETPPQAEESEDAAPPKKKIKRENTDDKTKNSRPVNLDELKKNNLVGKNQKRFVLFVGNIPYDTNKLDLVEHFKKCGEIKHIRIPTEKKSSRPRGFAYVEVGNEETYQKCLSMHHSFLKNRRINVLYTQGGKKKGEEKKKEIKAKNFKLDAMRKQGKLVGSKKETQKRSFRRAKQRKFKSEQETQD